MTSENEGEVTSLATEENIEVVQKSGTEYMVTLSETVIPVGTKSVKIPIWSKVNRQDDIKWYDAKKNSSGEYYVDVNKEHKYSMGIYNAHVYITDITVCRFFAGKVQQEVAVEEGSLTIVKNSAKEYTIQLKHVKMSSSVVREELRSITTRSSMSR